MGKKKLLTAIFVTVAICGAAVLGYFLWPKNSDDEFFKPNVSTVGVWWWHTAANSGIPHESIEWAEKNGVTEIYYAAQTSGTADNVQRQKDFIAKASGHNIKVFLLLGEWSWVNDDSDFRGLMTSYLEYQNTAPGNQKYAGIHLDVEPHQSPNWNTERTGLLNSYLSFVTRTVADYPSVSFDFDIPFWFTDEVTYKGQTVPLYKAVITEANRVFIMSYRDSADKMYNLGTVPQQIQFAKSLNKQIFLSSECSGGPEDNTVISYEEKGRRAMYEELNKLKSLAGYDKLGISIHHMRSWMNMKD